jgi:membrane protein
MRSLRFIRFFRHLNIVVLKQVIAEIGERRLPGLAAEMAYNAMLALFPAILAILTTIGMFEPSQSTFESLALQLSEVVPEQALNPIENFTAQLDLSKNQGLLSVSFIAALWVASAAVSAAMNALDRIFQIPRSQRRPFWKAKLMSIGLTVGTIILLVLASFLVFLSDLILTIAVNRVGLFESTILSAWRLLSWPIALVIVACAFAFIYRHGPSRWRKGTPIMPGALLGAILWATISGLFRTYVSNFGNYNQTYGAIGAVIVLLLWLDLSSLAILIGAQLNKTVGDAMYAKAEYRRLETPATESE